jgi:hypothetical protein
MYHPDAAFSRAAKEADHDWVTFGMGVIEVDTWVTPTGMPSLLYRTGHIRDHAWSENYAGKIDVIHKKWTPTARQLAAMPFKNIHPKVKEAATKEPETKVNCRRIVLPADQYDSTKTRGAPFIVITVDCDHDDVMEEVPKRWNPYVIPRWQTVSGSQYGWSPCTGPGLADARVLQSVVRVLLEAGEKAVDPPMVATQDAIRSDVAVYAGGITWVDVEYDEKLGEALRPLTQDRSGLPIGMEMADRLRNVLNEGFFINKITLPADIGKMTAYEVRKRLEEHVRASMPIVTPAEAEYSAAICERTFEVLTHLKAFGPVEEMPETMQGQDIRYEFRSPIREVTEEIKGQVFMEGLQVLGAAAQIDPAQVENVDLTKATRDALKGTKWPADWFKDEKAVAAKRAADQKAAMLAKGVEALSAGGQVGEQIGKAGKALAEAGIA